METSKTSVTSPQGESPARPPWWALGISAAVVLALIAVDWPLLPLLAHLAGSQPWLIVTIVLPFLMVYGLVARAYGIHLLFWDERPMRRGVAAFGLTLLVVNFAAVGYYVAIRPRDDVANAHLCRGLEAFYQRWEGLYPGLLPESGVYTKDMPRATDGECSAFFATESSRRIATFLAVAVPPPLLLLALPALFPRLARVPVQGLTTRRRARDLLVWFAGVAAGLVAAVGLFLAGQRLYDGLYSWRILEPDVSRRIERQLADADALGPLLAAPPADRAAWVDLKRRVDDLSAAFGSDLDPKQLRDQRRRLQVLQEGFDAGGEIDTAVTQIQRHWDELARGEALAQVNMLGALDRLSADRDVSNLSDKQALSAMAREVIAPPRPEERFGPWDAEARRQFDQIGVQVGRIRDALEFRYEDVRKVGVIGRATLSLLLVQLGVFGLFALVVPLYRVVTSALAICLLFSLLATTYTAAVSLVPADGVWALILVFGVVAAVALLNFRPYKLTFPGLAAYYDGAPAALAEALDVSFRAAPGTISDDRALDAWSHNHPDRQRGRKPKLVLVAVSGGAVRSALWVSLVLGELARTIPGFCSHIRVMSGASGGMVGAAYFVAALRRYRDQNPDGADPALERFPAAAVTDAIDRDSLDPVAKQLLLRDVPSIFQFWRQSNDRGRVLESTWEPGGLGVPFGELARDELDGRIPSLIFSPMLVEDGRRLLISNLELPYMIAAADRTLIDPQTEARYGRRLSTSAVEFRTLFRDPARVPRLPLSTAVRMSASFPYVSPAVNLPTAPLRSVVDAGYYDNYGISVAASWLFRHRDRLRELTSGVALIQIRDQVSQDSRLGTGPVQEQGPLRDVWAGFRFFTSPLQGAGSARYASTSFRNDESLMHLSAMLNGDDGDDFFTTVAFESGADVALSWSITDAELACLRAQFEPRVVEGCETNVNLERIARLADWWSKDHSGPAAPADGRGASGPIPPGVS